MKKLENFSIAELVDKFAAEWNLEILFEKDTFYKYPVIYYDGVQFRVFFKGALSQYTCEKLTKKILIHPEKNLNKYQMQQLQNASNGEYSEPGNS